MIDRDWHDLVAYGVYCSEVVSQGERSLKGGQTGKGGLTRFAPQISNLLRAIRRIEPISTLYTGREGKGRRRWQAFLDGCSVGLISDYCTAGAGTC